VINILINTNHKLFAKDINNVEQEGLGFSKVLTITIKWNGA